MVVINSVGIEGGFCVSSALEIINMVDSRSNGLQKTKILCLGPDSDVDLLVEDENENFDHLRVRYLMTYLNE